MSQTSNPPPVERGRTYSTILGSQSPIETTGQSLLPVEEPVA